MVEMKLKGGDTILAHPSKVESLKNMGWLLVEAEKPKAKKKAEPKVDTVVDSEEE